MNAQKLRDFKPRGGLINSPVYRHTALRYLVDGVWDILTHSRKKHTAAANGYLPGQLCWVYWCNGLAHGVHINPTEHFWYGSLFFIKCVFLLIRFWVLYLARIRAVVDYSQCVRPVNNQTSSKYQDNNHSVVFNIARASVWSVCSFFFYVFFHTAESSNKQLINLALFC